MIISTCALNYKCKYTLMWNHIVALAVTLVRGYPVVEESCVALHEGDGQLLEQPVDLQRLLFPSMPGPGTAELLHLRYGGLVPSSQRLGCDWNEAYSVHK